MSQYMSRYNVGDRVRIVDEWDPDGLCCQNWDGYMDQYLGTVVTIKDCSGSSYHIEEDQWDPHRPGRGWVWNDRCFIGLAEDTEKLDKNCVQLF